MEEEKWYDMIWVLCLLNQLIHKYKASFILNLQKKKILLVRLLLNYILWISLDVSIYLTVKIKKYQI